MTHEDELSLSDWEEANLDGLTLEERALYDDDDDDDDFLILLEEDFE